MLQEIDEFDGEFAFLSNFYAATINVDGMTFQSSEAAYQAQKCANTIDKFQFCNLGLRDAKKLGRKVKLRPDWKTLRTKSWLVSSI